MRSISAAVLLGGLAPTGAVLTRTVHDGRSQDPEQLRQYSFRQFVKEFERGYEPDSEEWSRREAVFNANLEDVVSFQSGPTQSWSKGITRFMDYTEAEYKYVLGYKGRASRNEGSTRLVEFARTSASELPSSMLLNKGAGDEPTLVTVVRDQGMCGSCWAEAATAVLEGALAKNTEALATMMVALNGTQSLATLSSQTMVSCTPNEKHCGGKGGCEGATVELAYDMVQKRGLPLAVSWGYVSGSGGTPTCRDDVFKNARVGITGYTVLPSNKQLPLKQAIVDTGAPIAISVDATGWSFYSGGIYSDLSGGSKGEFTVNHAVTLTGYQDKQPGIDAYYLIKNSWGPHWGERGFIRLEMKDKEDEHCGWDYKTHDGLACDGDPDTAWVCGTCGVLYDSVYPKGVHVMTGA